jgi:hypothetical protein
MDGPDNAQELADGSYAPCLEAAAVQSRYAEMVANDATRPIYLGFGRGVADTDWIGRGECAGRTDMYADYAAGADILAFNVYPVNQGLPLEVVATGVANLRRWSDYEKPVFALIEASNYEATARPTPAQIEAEVWMALIHGAAGIQYFCHRFLPTFSETDCLEDAPTQAALGAINARITELASVLNTPSRPGLVVETAPATLPVAALLKQDATARYVFAVAMRDAPVTATFVLSDGAPSSEASVIGESRTLPVSRGVFSDDFSGHAVHLYRIPL